MYKFVATTIITSALLLACSAEMKVYKRLDNDTFTAVFYENKCSNDAVLSMISKKDQEAMGDKFKSGVVTFKKTKEVRQFCYIVVDKNENGELVAILDEQGSTPMLVLDPKE